MRLCLYSQSDKSQYRGGREGGRGVCEKKKVVWEKGRIDTGGKYSHTRKRRFWCVRCLSPLWLFVVSSLPQSSPYLSSPLHRR